MTQGADLGGQYAAGLAAASMLFKDTDRAYAAALLDAAERAYAFAEASLGAKCVPRRGASESCNATNHAFLSAHTCFLFLQDLASPGCRSNWT